MISSSVKERKPLLFVVFLCLLLALVSGTTNPFPGSANENSHTILSDVTKAIGKTPLVDLSRITKHYGLENARILAKLEYLSPGGSKKDRIALEIIERARWDGSLQPKQTVVELTSGNTGTGLAIVCGVLGHPFVAVMSKGNSRERAKMMEALGARVVLVDQANAKSTAGSGVSGADLDLVEEKAKEVCQELNAFRVDQFLRESNSLAHYYHTGPELWKDSGGIITDFLDFVGTGGSFGGIAKYLKERDNSVRCYVVEPTNAVVLGQPSWCSTGSHRIQGGGYMKSGDDLPLIGPKSSNDDENKNNPWVDGYLTVTDEEAIQGARDLARYEGIFAGYSAGANLVAAIKLLKERQNKNNDDQQQENSVVAILICDTGLKYMSTDLWESKIY